MLSCGPFSECHTANWCESVACHVAINRLREPSNIASLAESTYWGYRIGFPFAGTWKEIFNSDVYDHFVNPIAAGNGGGVSANGPGTHGFSASASIVIPANGVIVFARQ